MILEVTFSVLMLSVSVVILVFARNIWKDW